MTTNQLKYFITVAECLNFTEAGKKHFISQTAITQHIQALEQSLGVQLFTRSRRHVELTPTGKVFLEEAKAILDRTQMAIERTKRAATGFSGNLNIGYVKGLEGARFGHILKDFYRENPNILFQLYRENHLDLFVQLDQDKIDVAFNITYPTTDLSRYESIFIRRSPLYAILYPEHRYAQLSSIVRYDLRNEPYFLTKFYDNPMSKNLKIPEIYATSGFIPQVAGRSTDIETNLLLVAAGIGITILPEHAIRNIKNARNLVCIPLEGKHEYVDVQAIYKPENQNPALKRFLEQLKDTLSQRIME